MCVPLLSRLGGVSLLTCRRGIPLPGRLRRVSLPVCRRGIPLPCRLRSIPLLTRRRGVTLPSRPGAISLLTCRRHVPLLNRLGDVSLLTRLRGILLPGRPSLRLSRPSRDLLLEQRILCRLSRGRRMCSDIRILRILRVRRVLRLLRVRLGGGPLPGRRSLPAERSFADGTCREALFDPRTAVRANHFIHGTIFLPNISSMYRQHKMISAARNVLLRAVSHSIIIQSCGKTVKFFCEKTRDMIRMFTRRLSDRPASGDGGCRACHMNPSKRRSRMTSRILSDPNGLRGLFRSQDSGPSASPPKLDEPCGKSRSSEGPFPPGTRRSDGGRQTAVEGRIGAGSGCGGGRKPKKPNENRSEISQISCFSSHGVL